MEIETVILVIAAAAVVVNDYDDFDYDFDHSLDYSIDAGAVLEHRQKTTTKMMRTVTTMSWKSVV